MIIIIFINFTDEETKDQTGCVTCAKSHSYYMVELGLKTPKHIFATTLHFYRISPSKFLTTFSEASRMS